jgi:hypothetical protein
MATIRNARGTTRQDFLHNRAKLGLDNIFRDLGGVY